MNINITQTNTDTSSLYSSKENTELKDNENKTLNYDNNNNNKKNDIDLKEFEKKNKILCETFDLVEGESTKNLFPPEVFERVASIINSKFYKILETSLEKIPNTNISKKIKVKSLKIITCFYPSQNQIDYMELKKLMFEGLPEELPELRSILWKLFLNYYPNNLNEWESFSREKNEDYERLKLDLLNGDEKEKYKSVIYEITADISRTRTDMNFFYINNTNDNSNPNNPSQEKNNKDNESTNNIDKTDNRNNKQNLADLLSRILLIFAILHPDLAYIQGMNEILATIYFCFAKSNDSFLESELFYCFENFMLEVKDIYLKENDSSSRGIHGIVKIIENLLEYHDPELANHFKDIGIEINFFALRWILIFFSQEFFMPETMRLWDSLIIETDKFKFITFVCLGVITKKRKELLNLEFADAMFSLQNLKTLEFSIDEILVHSKLIQKNLEKMYQAFVID